MAMPKANIFWRDIPLTSEVVDRGHYYEVTDLRGKKAVAFWTGQEARAAQQALARRAKGKAR